mmetsp:Transcript_30704/g.99297  ORF Transcript_30704/g.99297 Transcript_30704/m.99297 type:complete len:298 (+) Transcript_30704:867-1760(+)|eukprot:scaffold33304_cov129-Isochrysis_galbana.AAC.1
MQTLALPASDRRLRRAPHAVRTCSSCRPAAGSPLPGRTRASPPPLPPCPLRPASRPRPSEPRLPLNAPCRRRRRLPPTKRPALRTRATPRRVRPPARGSGARMRRPACTRAWLRPRKRARCAGGGAQRWRPAHPRSRQMRARGRAWTKGAGTCRRPQHATAPPSGAAGSPRPLGSDRRTRLHDGATRWCGERRRAVHAAHEARVRWRRAEFRPHSATPTPPHVPRRCHPVEPVPLKQRGLSRRSGRHSLRRPRPRRSGPLEGVASDRQDVRRRRLPDPAVAACHSKRKGPSTSRSGA